MGFGIQTAGFFLQDQLNSLLGASSNVGGGNDLPRIPMVFTSTLRQSGVNDQGARFVQTQQHAGAPAPATGATQIPPTTFQGTATSQSPDPATFFSNTGAIQRSITMLINPSSIRFKQPKRMTKRDTMNGSVFFHFTNSKGQNNDILTLDFRGNTGNIDQRGSQLVNNGASTAFTDTGARAKLIAWQNLYLLTREPILLNNGQENVTTITYSSPLIPIPLDFHGFFNEVLSFEETGEEPNSREYSMSFTVTSTSPDLDDLLIVVQQAVAANFAVPSLSSVVLGDPNGLQIPPGTTLNNQ